MNFSDLDQDSINNILDYIEVELHWYHFSNPYKTFYGFFPNSKRVAGNHSLIFKNIKLTDQYYLKFLPSNITGLKLHSEIVSFNEELFRFKKLKYLEIYTEKILFIPKSFNLALPELESLKFIRKDSDYSTIKVEEFNLKDCVSLISLELELEF